MTLYTKELEEQLIAFRKDLHQQPELSNQEYRTTQKIKDKLESEGIRILDLPLVTGLIARIDGSEPGPTIALRADIDALPIQEQAEVDLPSQVPGVMHACGHDFHTTALLGAATLLNKRRDDIKGTILLIFQAAEETGGGARRFMATGVLDEAQAVLGFHNDPTLPLGVLGTKPGALTSAVDHFELTITGSGAHAAKPHEGNDPIIVGTQFVNQVQSIISRTVDPRSHSVVSITQFSSGDTWNVIPESAYLQGTVRTFDKGVRQQVEARMHQIAEGLTLSYDCVIDFKWTPSASSVVNSPVYTEAAFRIAEEVGFETCLIEETPIGEDFAYYLEEIPGAFVMVGTGTGYPLHHPKFTVDDRALEGVVDYFVNFALDLLD